MKRHWFVWLIFGISFMVSPGDAREKAPYPSRSIELVVGYGPGGTNDLAARAFHEDLAKILKVPVVIVNRPGGGGIQAAFYVARAKKDGYTLFSSSGATMIISPIITREATYDTLRDFFPLGYFGDIPPSVLAVTADSPLKSFRQVVDYARKYPGKLKGAVGGIGTAGYNNLKILCARANINIAIVPFKSGAESTIAILGGHVDLAFGGFTTLGPHVKAGTVRALAVVSEKRYPLYPHVPTTAEEGYPYVNYNEGIGLFSPAGLPKPVLDVLIPAVEKAFKKPEVIARGKAAEFTVNYMNPEQYRKGIESQQRTWGKLFKDVGLSVR